MELDDLKAAWRELDRRLESVLALDRRVLRELKLDKTRSALRRLTGLLVFELIAGVPAVLLLGSFLAEHYAAARFVAPALLLHAVTLFTILASVRQLAMVARIDYSAPILTIQHALAELRASRIRTTYWILVLAPPLWTPLAIVSAKGLFGFDVYREFGPLWVTLNLGVCLAPIPLAIWVARRYAGSFHSSRILEYLADIIAGRSLATARSLLEEIAKFEEER